MSNGPNQLWLEFKGKVKMGLAAAQRRALGRHAMAVLVQSRNGLLAVDPDDFAVGRFLRRDGEYGWDEVERIAARLEPDDNILMVGAHIGALAVPLSKRCRRMTAIEANPAAFALLELNLRLNGVDNCRAIQAAAGDADGEIDFLVNTINSGGSKRAPRLHNRLYYYDRPRRITVKSIALDNCLGDETFDIVVMDIEGSEYLALLGMKRILERCRVLIVEFVPHHLRDVAGVSVEQFLSALPACRRMIVPSLGMEMEPPEFRKVLERIYDSGASEDALIFEK